MAVRKALTESRKALITCKKLLVKLSRERLNEVDEQQLYQLRVLTGILARLIPLELLQEKNKPPVGVDVSGDKEIMEDFLRREFSRLYGEDQLNNPPAGYETKNFNPLSGADFDD